MNVLNKIPNKLTQDEMRDGDISENHTGDTFESEEEEKVSESGDESSSEDKGHLFPTPPPDADANVTAEAMPVVMGSKKKGEKILIIDMALAAIGSLKSRSGSSIRAIVKYILSTGYEVPNVKRFSTTLYKRLKDAAASGVVIQEKLSFKLPAGAKKSKLIEKVKSKSIDKMKEKAAKKKLVKKQEAKAQLEDAEQVEEGAKAKKVTKKASVPKTTEPGPEKKKAYQAAVKEQVKEKKPKKQASKPQNTKPVEANNIDSSLGENAKKQKAKPARKSIGTLAQSHAKRKPQVKAIKKLTAGKAALKNPDEIDSDMDHEPTQTSTPVLSGKQKGKGQKRKAN